MRLATVGSYPVTLGWVIALIGLILDIVFAAIGQIEIKVALLIGLALLARLI
jgi:hypothetical protein